MPTPAMLERISKHASKGFLLPGETVVYTIHLEIGWNETVKADVKDPLPVALEYVAGSADNGGVYDAAAHAISWTGIAVANGAPVDLKFAMKFAKTVTQPTPVLNVASISWNGFMMQRAAWVTLLPQATPGVGGLQGSFKSAAPRLLGAGEKVTYTIHLINNGAAPATVAVSDPLPLALAYVADSASAGGVYDPLTRTVSWKDVLVPPFNPALPVEPIALTFAAQAPALIPPSIRPLLVTNTAEITPSGGQAFKRSADILLVDHPVSPLQGSFKAASQREVGPGQVFSYTIQLHNSSPSPVSTVVKDPLPPALSYVAGSANADGVYDETSRTLTWNNLTVPEGSGLELTFKVKAPDAATAASLKIVNTAEITAGGITLRRSVPVILVLNPGGDNQPPRVESVTIAAADVLTAPEVTLHIAASDNVGVTRMFIKEWALTTDPKPHWKEVQASGWIPFQAEAPWTLDAQSGTHFIGVWVADAAMNKSHLTPNAIDFASLLLPGTAVAQNGMVPYLVYYPAGVETSATLSVLTGTARLFAWMPGNLFSPDHSGPAPVPAGSSQTVSFTTQTAGIYLFLVTASEASTFDLSITPAGGPRLPLKTPPAPAASAAGLSMGGLSASPAALDAPTANPILPQSGEDPLSVAQDPAGPYFQVYLPAIR